MGDGGEEEMGRPEEVIRGRAVQPYPRVSGSAMVNGYLRILPPPIWDAGYNPVFSPFSASNIPPTSPLR